MKPVDAQVRGCYIDGEWVVPKKARLIEVKNPGDGSILAYVPRGDREEIDLAVKAAKKAFHSKEWQTFSSYHRGKLLYQAAEIIRENKQELTKLETLDVGKPLSQSAVDVEIAARYFEYYAGIADKILGETIPVEPGIIDYTVREPIGIVGHIIPWNYPLQIAARSISVSIATGNAAVLKPAEDTPLTTLKLVEVIEPLGLPKGILNVVTGYGHEAGAALSAHPEINHITFTGSVETGKKVMESAAQNIVPVTLELGGKSPNIVFADCNEEQALKWVLKSIIQNAGQTCSAGSRLVIEKSIKEKFVRKLAAAMEKLSIGPGMDDHDLGPVLSKKQFDRIQGFIDLAKQDGIRIVTGGERQLVEGCEQGYYLQPTILDDVPVSHDLAQEEIFGPVLTVTTFETEEEAIEMANGTPYGLVAGIWTENVGVAHRVASGLQCGQVFINHYGAGGGIAQPFGGYKKSGFGREKGLEALQNYTQVKNVALKY
ncbi:aldehyde dehydrogenase family protein [Neobacillus sp. OS1-32]|uniref:Aldehyde dehydrogenase family protein n=1 Tax=Neobacillus paridis TaxID=2803862 RepID=A0ABS1TNM4_9BACI|nr:aldehyde dehydrogenase family protein [Neobacillus sp. OS1-32]MBL4952773.1 aldehyde dehydrogenase family protein [Neobacillus paridis]WML31702.1 aldehyde dehydrogenase family protein [Neobacillus sp. OS1-32]